MEVFKKIILGTAVALSVLACREIPTAQSVVDQAIENAGLAALENAEVWFSFRDKQYTFDRDNGMFTYTRSQSDTAGNNIVDVYTNDGFERFINDTMAEITAEKRAAYTNSVNSVIYFAFLPLWLNDAAVFKTYLGEVEVKGKQYHKIKVAFSEDGGGTDHEDQFVYWFDIEDYTMDYLAYSYKTNEGGMRFREAFNSRTVEGVLMQDFHNYEPRDAENAVLEDLDKLFENNALLLLSEIELTDVVVKIRK